MTVTAAVTGETPAGGIGFSKNSAVRQSSGTLLLFLDADDVMLPRRVAAQVAALHRHPTAIAGCVWRRIPVGSSAYWEQWANGLSQRQLWLQQYREATLPMPTWAMSRATFERVGGFEERPPKSGEAEDLRFFLRHCELHECESGGRAGRDDSSDSAAALAPLVRAEAKEIDDESGEKALMLYRWSPNSGCSRVRRRQLLSIRAASFERRVLAQPSWQRPGFVIWGAGRDGRNFLNELSPEARARVVAMCDVDPNKVGTRYCNWRAAPPIDVPIVHFSEAKGPVVVCVSLRRGTEEKKDEPRGGQAKGGQAGGAGAGQQRDDCAAGGDLLRNVQTLNLEEGRDLWFFT